MCHTSILWDWINISKTCVVFMFCLQIIYLLNWFWRIILKKYISLYIPPPKLSALGHWTCANFQYCWQCFFVKSLLINIHYSFVTIISFLSLDLMLLLLYCSNLLWLFIVVTGIHCFTAWFPCGIICTHTGPTLVRPQGKVTWAFCLHLLFIQTPTISN